MNFVRSRIALVGLLVAWPAAQLGGCAPKERNYDPVEPGEGGMGGTSGTGKGGTSGTGKGGTSGKGGSVATGGTGADAGETGSGGSTSGTAGKGGSGKGGSSTGGTDPGTGGTGDTGSGGEAGSPEPDPDCVATGDEVCSDGLDNDCDGTTDCLELVDQFPTLHGAASAADVAYTFATPADGATFQCRTTHGDTSSGTWRACPAVSGSTVSPFAADTAADPATDGYYTTDVRLRFADGAISELFRRPVYVHHSLAGVERCAETASDQAYIAAAMPHLTDEGAFDPSTARSPFVQVAFEPPVSVKYQVEDTEGTVNWRSLRRVFTFSPDKHYMVMKRTYSARAAAGMGCYAAIKRVHHTWGSSRLVPSPMTYQSCTALVFNKKGAGYCLDYIGGAVVSAEHLRSDAGVAVPAPDYSPEADNFAWRKLTNPIRPGAGHFMSNFSSKCDDEGCAEVDVSGYTLFLPDKQYFSYWP